MSTVPDQPPPDITAGEFREWFAMADHDAVPDPDGEPLIKLLSESDRERVSRLLAGINAPPGDRDAAARTYRPGDPLSPQAEPLREIFDADYQAHVAEGARYEQLRRDARRKLDAEEQELARGGRKDMSWADLLALPKPEWVYEGLLTVGFHGLAGPPEAGKSLLARNWCCEVAASGRNVVYALSEGQFDLADRFGIHTLIEAAKEHLFFLDGGFSLTSASDVAWFCGTYRERKPALVVLDMIYGFGLPDDNGVQGVAPVISGCKKIATELSCAVVAVGHPGLAGERRFRGSSMWRGSFDSEWHMADGEITCEKHKYANRLKLRWPYAVDFPYLRVLGEGEVLSQAGQRMNVIAADISMYPDDPDAVRARRLKGALGVGEDRARTLIRSWKKNQF
jgi:AAA domain